MASPRIDQVSAQGRWQAAAARAAVAGAGAAGTPSGTAVEAGHGHAGRRGALQLELPGTHTPSGKAAWARVKARANCKCSSMNPSAHDWWDGLPGRVALLPQWRLRGQAQLDARWTGGWQGLQRQLQQAGWLAASATAPQAKVPAMALQAQLRVPQWSMAPVAVAGPRAQEAAALQLRDVRLQWQGDVAQWQLEARSAAQRHPRSANPGAR